MHLEALTTENKEVFDKLKGFQEYYLAGGTALALQIGHRKSVDFDLFSDKEIPFPLILDLLDYEGFKLLSVKEIAVSKAYTIGRRGSYKDYIDLYFVISEGHSSLREIIEIAEKKYGHEFNSRLFLEQLIYLEDVEDTEIIFLKNEVNRDYLKEFFETKIKELKL